MLATEGNPVKCNFYHNSHRWFLNKMDCASFTTIYYVHALFTYIFSFVVLVFLTCIFNTLWIKNNEWKLGWYLEDIRSKNYIINNKCKWGGLLKQSGLSSFKFLQSNYLLYRWEKK